MIGIIHLVLLMAASFNITTPASIQPESSSVTVRRGEPLRLSFDIYIPPGETIVGSLWIRNGDILHPYDTVNVSTCRPEIQTDVSPAPCATSRTIDYRGRVVYKYKTNATATTTLTIDDSSSEDNTTFRCVVEKRVGGRQQSEQIYVTVYYLPNATSPICVSSNFSEVPGLPSNLTCSAGESQPSASLEWVAVDEDSKRTSLSNLTTVIQIKVENTLDLTILEIPIHNLVFTCFMTSRAYPEFRSNCTTGPFVIQTTETTKGSTFTTLSTVTDQPVSPLSGITVTTLSTVTDQPVSRLSGITVIAATAGGGAAFFILILIIVCVVSSRKNKTRRGTAVQSRATVFGRQLSDTARLATSAPDYENREGISLPAHRRRTKANTPSDQAGSAALVYAYASVTPGHRQPTSPPLYAVLDPDVPSEAISASYAYASVEKVAGHRQDWSEDAASDSSWEDDDPQDYHELVPGTRVGLSYQEIEQSKGGGDGDNDSATVLVDNVLYVPSTDDVILQAKFKGHPIV